jgi:hypothetical protein
MPAAIGSDPRFLKRNRGFAALQLSLLDASVAAPMDGFSSLDSPVYRSPN